MAEERFSGFLRSAQDRLFDCVLPSRFAGSVRLAQDDRRIEIRNVEVFLFDDPLHQNVCPMLKKKLKCLSWSVRFSLPMGNIGGFRLYPRSKLTGPMGVR